MSVKRCLVALVPILLIASPGFAPPPEEGHVYAEVVPFWETGLIVLPAPGEQTLGLTWDEENDQLWASDQQEEAIFRRSATGSWERVLSWGGKPGPIAIDRENRILWVVDEVEGMIVPVDISVPTLAKAQGIHIPQAALREVPSITGLAWDERFLWLATACGLCSTIFWIDIESEDVVESFYPYCIPRGLAFRRGRSDAQAEIWSVAFNGGVRPALVSRYLVPGGPSFSSGTPSFYPFVPLSGPAMVLAGAPPIDPTAVSVVDDRLLVVDGSSDVIRQYQLPTPQQIHLIVQ